MAVSLALVPVIMPLLARLRQLFDLDAEPVVVGAHLAQGGLAPLVARHRGIRIPGAVDPFEVVVPALIRGTADSTAAARQAMWRVVQELGEPLLTGVPGLDRLALTAERVADAGAARLQELGVAPRRALLAIDGVSDQLATAILIRTLYWLDAFPASDPVLQRAAAVSGPGGLRARAERWRPWRAHAALHLWLAEMERLGAATPVG